MDARKVWYTFYGDTPAYSEEQDKQDNLKNDAALKYHLWPGGLEHTIDGIKRRHTEQCSSLGGVFMRQFTSKAFGPARKHKYLETCRWVLIGACFMGASSRFKACNEVIVLDPNARAGFSSGTPTPTVTASATPTATVTLTPTPTPTETATPTPDLFFFSAGNETNNSGNGSGATAGNSGGNSGASSGTTGSSTNSNGNSATQALRGSGSWDSANSPSDSDSLGGAGADDADLDGMSDADEETYLTNPHLPDTDGDGYLDGFELANGSSPTDPSSFPAQSYYPPVPLGVSPEFDPRDRDGDGLLNLVEEELSLNPDKADTDGDSIFDGAELLSGTSAHEANQLVDTDSDGLSDEAELRFGTSPTNPDTDGDGLSDAYEILYGYNPLNPGTGGGIVDGRLPASARNYRFKNSGFHFNQ